MMDVRVEMFDELRRFLPAVYDADRFLPWRAALGQVIASFPTEDRRFACAALIANDLCAAIPGLQLSVAFSWVMHAVQLEEVNKR